MTTLFGEVEKRPSEQIVRQAYEGAAERCARLLSFAGAAPISSDIDISDRQERMAIDDLVSFALYARRLIDVTEAQSLARNRFVGIISASYNNHEIIFPKTGREISVWRLLGIIIHHEKMLIIRYEFVLQALSGAKPWDIDLGINTPEKSFPAKMFIKSDKSDVMLIDIHEFICTFLKGCLEKIVRSCERKEIFLDPL